MAWVWWGGRGFGFGLRDALWEFEGFRFVSFRCLKAGVSLQVWQGYPIHMEAYLTGFCW
jgi:hypothetical protein